MRDALDGEDEGDGSDYRRRLRASVRGMIAREALLSPKLASRRLERLADIGVSDHGRLVDEILSGDRALDSRLLNSLGDEVLDQLLVVNPGYVGRADDVV